jgi:hypothetical protein
MTTQHACRGAATGSELGATLVNGAGGGGLWLKERFGTGLGWAEIVGIFMFLSF